MDKLKFILKVKNQIYLNFNILKPTYNKLAGWF